MSAYHCINIASLLVNDTNVVVAMSVSIGEWLNNFLIEALLPSKTSAALCAEVVTAFKTKEKRYISCLPGTVGRFVRIRMNGMKPGNLSLCEVEVYGGKSHIYVYILYILYIYIYIYIYIYT